MVIVGALIRGVAAESALSRLTGTYALPVNGATVDAATARTAGRPPSCAEIRSRNVFLARAVGNPATGSDTSAAHTPCVAKPSGSLRSCRTVRTSSAAQTSSRVDSATWATSISHCARCAGAETRWPSPLRTDAPSEDDDTRHAGIRPATIVVVT